MVEQRQLALSDAAEWLGDWHPLAEQLGSTDGLMALGSVSSRLRLRPVQDAGSLRNFLRKYQRQILVPVELPKLPYGAMTPLLTAEAAAAFDDLTLSGRDKLLTEQGPEDWPNDFRIARFYPAVEYIQANRIRYLLIQEMAKTFKDIDLFVSPSFDGDCNQLTNQTGYPCVVLPDGFSKEGMPTSICFIGNLFGEAKILAVAKAYQDATDFHKKHPSLDKLDQLKSTE